MARVSRLIALMIALLVASCPAAMAGFAVKRAISMDQWVTWPDPARWNDAAVLDKFPEWRAFVSQAELERLAEAGFDTVRLPVDPAIFLIDPDPVRRARLFAGVLVSVDMLRDAGLNVIVDMHMIPRGDGPAPGVSQVLEDPALFAAYLDLLTAMASQLRIADSDHVALEVMNEPSSPCDSQADRMAWNNTLERLHRAARDGNQDMTLVLSGACGGSAEGLAATDPGLIGDDNVLWSFHHYRPFILTHQSAGWAGHRVKPLSRIPYPPETMTAGERDALIAANDAAINRQLSGLQALQARRSLRDHLGRMDTSEKREAIMREPFQIVADWAEKHGIAPDRVFLGEFGMIGQEYDKEPATDPAWRIAFMKDIAGLAEEYGFGWSVWSFGGAFGLAQGFGGAPARSELLDQFPGTLPQN